jgi:hypothetical protein
MTVGGRRLMVIQWMIRFILVLMPLMLCRRGMPNGSRGALWVRVLTHHQMFAQRIGHDEALMDTLSVF